MPDRVYSAQVRVFHAKGAMGNLHHIIYAPDAADLPAANSAVPNLVRLHGQPGSMHVDYTNYGQPVRRCGSGSLAVAAFVNEYFAFTNPLLLQARSGNVEIGFDQLSAYYVDTPLRQQPLSQPNPWPHIISQAIVDGCYCGDRDSYVLLEVDAPLRQIRPHLRALCQLSRRALIVVRRVTPNKVELRYFAPQYGPAEDTATGSASVQVAAYLYQRYSITGACIQQCSPGGGVIDTEYHGRHVRIRGRTTLSH